jgi:hypothetical protein
MLPALDGRIPAGTPGIESMRNASPAFSGDVVFPAAALGAAAVGADDADAAFIGTQAPVLPVEGIVVGGSIRFFHPGSFAGVATVLF